MAEKTEKLGKIQHRHGLIDSMNTVTTENSRQTLPPILTAHDRCDQCGARAWVRVTLATGTLNFCAHHANQHLEAITPKALDIIDEREFATQQS